MYVRPDGYFAEKSTAELLVTEDAFLSSTEVSPAKIFELLGVKQGQKRKAIEMESAGC